MRRASCTVCYGFRPMRRTPTLSPRYSGTAPRATGGCWTLTWRRASTPSRARPVDRVRARILDDACSTLVRLPRAGVLTELRRPRGPWTATPQRRILSPRPAHRHWPSRAGNRRPTTCPTWPGSSSSATTSSAGAYDRRLAAGKTPMVAMRCLRRRLSDAVYRQLAADTRSQQEASPGGHPGASLTSSAAGLPPDTGTSDQPLPGPAHPTLPLPAAVAPAAAIPRRRARGVNVERPTGRTTLTPTSAAAPSVPGRPLTNTRHRREPCAGVPYAQKRCICIQHYQVRGP